jgi:WhiB family redox-sensing transcriptional regulator
MVMTRSSELTDPRDQPADTPRIPGREPWMADALCHGRTQLFFGIAGERPERRVRREARARKLCHTCPVLPECRSMARANGENGFWGGETEEERAAAGHPPISISRRSVQEAAAVGVRIRAEAS